MSLFFELIRERKKSLPRILMNRAFRTEVGALKGDVLDIGGGSSSYERHLDLSDARLVSTNIDTARKPTKIHDFNAPLPFPNASFDAVLLINVIYILRDPAMAVREMARVLRPGGQLVMTSPLMFGESPEPEDFLRFTSMGLHRLLDGAGFKDARIVPLGGRCVAAEALIESRIPFDLFRLIARLKALLLDRTLYRKLNRVHPAPHSYFVTANKPLA